MSRIIKLTKRLGSYLITEIWAIIWNNWMLGQSTSPLFISPSAKTWLNIIIHGEMCQCLNEPNCQTISMCDIELKKLQYLYQTRYQQEFRRKPFVFASWICGVNLGVFFPIIEYSMSQYSVLQPTHMMQSLGPSLSLARKVHWRYRDGKRFKF